MYNVYNLGLKVDYTTLCWKELACGLKSSQIVLGDLRLRLTVSDILENQRSRSIFEHSQGHFRTLLLTKDVILERKQTIGLFDLLL